MSTLNNLLKEVIKAIKVVRVIKIIIYQISKKTNLFKVKILSRQFKNSRKFKTTNINILLEGKLNTLINSNLCLINHKIIRVEAAKVKHQLKKNK
jgi:hypothetical protein